MPACLPARPHGPTLACVRIACMRADRPHTRCRAQLAHRAGRNVCWRAEVERAGGRLVNGSNQRNDE
eukprot:158324-Chlamydomonas_euryale.AAC.2